MSEGADPAAFGAYARALRGERRGRDVAAAAGISVQYLSDIEGGHRLPPPATITALAHALGTDANALRWLWVEAHLGRTVAADLERWLGA